MSWRDHHDHGEPGDPYRNLGRPGGDWQGIRRTLDNPMTWSLPVMRCFGIAVRMHVAFAIYIVVRLARSIGSADAADGAPTGLGLAALDLGCLFLVVLLHEFGHCFACRAAGGAAEEILMWPLGGLAFCRPPSRWSAHLLTAGGGPLVNVAIFMVLAPLLAIRTGQWWGVGVPDPFGPLPLGALGRETWWVLVLYTLHEVSFLLLLFNLLPIFPLDGGRILQACLWPRLGYARSMRRAVYVGYFGAIGLGIYGAVQGSVILIAIAVFGGVTCYVTLKQVEWTESIMGAEGDPYAASLWGEDDKAPAEAGGRRDLRRARKQERRRQREQEEQAEVDRILAKIGRQGVESLSGRERSVLRRATARRKQTDA